MVLLDTLIHFSNITILSAFRSDEDGAFLILNVKKKKNKLEITSFSSHDDLDTAIKATDKKKPVILLVEGKGILNKRIDPANEIDINWKKNVDYNTIYYTEYKTDKYSFLSFCRKQQVDEIMAKLQAEKVMILDLYIGPLMAALLNTSINNKTLACNDVTLEFEGNTLIDIKKQQDIQPKAYNFNDKDLPHQYLSMYGTALHYFLKQENVAKSEHPLIRREDILYKKAFEKLGIGMLIVFFIALLANYFVIQYYSVSNIELNQKNLFTNQTYQYITELEEQREQKTKILNESGRFSKNYLTYYAYELSRSIPVSSQIGNLTIFPIKEETKTKQIKLVANTITIKGSTTNESEFNGWLTDLKKFDWVDTFEIISFKKDKKDIQQFEIKIIIKNV